MVDIQITMQNGDNVNYWGISPDEAAHVLAGIRWADVEHLEIDAR